MGRPASPIVVRTRHAFLSPADRVWPLLCNSKMDRRSALLFRLGVPQPLECRLPDGRGAVGNERECVSDQGVVRQKILIWEPERRLVFRMEKSTIDSAKSVSEIEDAFLLVPNGTGVTVFRTTTAGTVGRFRFAKKFALGIALKQVHRYVFRNWDRLAAEDH